jgi:hypothetical protein
MGSQMMAQNITINWLANKGNRTHLDEVEWPNNKPCSHKAAINNLVT